MLPRRRIIYTLVILLIAASAIQAEGLAGRSRIGLFGGYAGRGGESNVLVTETGVNVSSGDGGAMGGVLFGHWL